MLLRNAIEGVVEKLEMDMKTDLMNAIGRVFRRRWTVSILLAAIWTAIVTIYVLSGLRPHGYIGDGADAISTWLGWMVGGGILLAWVMRKFLFDASSWQRPRMGELHTDTQAIVDEEMGFEWRQPEEDSEERRYARGVWSIYDSDELDFGR
jgi:hypothetical protein